MSSVQPPKPPFQSRNYLMEMLSSYGLRPRRQLGQNFLIDQNLLDLLVQSACLTRSDVVLEIGAGTGGLTAKLAATSGHVVAVELDAGFYRLAQRQTATMRNVTVLHADALEHKHRMNRLVLDFVQDQMRALTAGGYHLVANLPYDVATLVIGNLVLADPAPLTMTVTIQFEVANRMLAQSGSRDYGPLAVLLQMAGNTELIRVISPSVFWPRPKVTSAMVRFVSLGRLRERVPYVDVFYPFVRECFRYRRKSVRRALALLSQNALSPAQIDAVLDELKMPDAVRAEQLSPERLYTLYQALRAATDDAVGSR